MKKTALFTSAAILGGLLTACDPSSEEISKAGYEPVAKPDTTLTCYDYNGNVSLKEKPDNGVSEHTGYTQANYKSGKPTIVMGGAGCISEKFHFNVNDTTSQIRFQQVENSAPYTAVVTNGVDKILLSGRFTDVSAQGESGYTTLKLEKDGTTLREVTVKGLQVTATAHPEGIPDYIRNAEQAPVGP